jgi:hypothetical protein
MRRLPALAHQRHTACGRRKFALVTRSASASVVEEIAPRCTIASREAPCVRSHSSSSSGAISSRSATLARLRHLPAARSRSQTASAAARFEPMKPAPPVTRIM